MKINKVAIIGECMVELKKTDGSLKQGFGGDTLNTAIYLSRLTNSHGVTTSYLTGVGNDPFSTDMIKSWNAENINTDMVHIDHEKLTGIYAIETADDGERSFFYWRNDSAAKYWLRHQTIPTLVDALSTNQLIYLSGISLAILPEDCRDKLLQVLHECRSNGCQIAFDNNYRPKLWSTTQLAKKWYQAVLELTDIAFLTFDDDVMLWGDSAIQDAVKRTKSFGVNEIVIKCGAEPCLIYVNNEEHSVSPTPINSIIDTTAAGDSFSAGYLAKRVLGGDCKSSAAAGHTVAGTVIQHHGAVIPKENMPNI